MGHAELILRMVELTLAHAGEMIDLVKETSDDIRAVGDKIKALHAAIKERNDNALTSGGGDIK